MIGTLAKCLAFAGALLLLTGSGAQARDYRLGALRIGAPWARPTPAGAPTAAGYLTVTNTGPGPDRLLGASSPSVARIEIHQMTMTDNIMRMRQVVGGLAIAPGQTLSIAPEGYHLMMIAPKHPFVAGQMIPATLRFEKAGAINIVFSVQSSAPAGGRARPMTMP